ncbi:MAG: hypothetical protein IPK58_25310 [Acidobacteria bacterium]|nr:hypothetical protein [Acidobacteriota bacterium]
MSDRRMRLAARICGKARPFRRRQLATRLRRQSAMGEAGDRACVEQKDEPFRSSPKEKI